MFASLIYSRNVEDYFRNLDADHRRALECMSRVVDGASKSPSFNDFLISLVRITTTFSDFS